MKKNTLIYYFLSFFSGIGLLSCSDYEIISSENINTGVQSRAFSDALDYYYYYKGEKIPLSINTSKRYIVTRQNTNSLQVLRHTADLNIVYENTVGDIVDINDNHTTKMSSYNINTLDLLQSNPDIVAIEYIIGDSIQIPLSNLFYIKLKQPSDLSLLAQEADKIGCDIETVMASDESWIRLSCPKEALPNTSLEASNYLYETGLFEDVDPGFILKYEMASTPSDPYYNSQWGLNGYHGIHAETAWNITKGKPSITIAIIDGGIYTRHADLAGRMHSYAYNCDNGSNSPTYHDHATMCAGIVAANHNNIAIAGIAPNTKLMNISSTFPNVANLSELLANGINKAWQNGADVINISWGDQGGGLYNKLHSSLLESALNNALINGRNGKGCIVCFAAGNHTKIDYPGYCNPDIMVVGSINSNGNVSSFSGRGNELDVVAPGENIISLNSNGNCSSFNGTSFAAPHVAGIAALILSVNPALTQKQVCTIIKETTDSKKWNKNTGFGLARASRAIEATTGSFSIDNQWGSSAFAIAKFYVSDLPKSAKVQWSTTQNIATVLRYANDTIEYHYNFSGRSMKDEIKATITYCGMVSHISYPITVYNEPKITGVEQIYYAPAPDRIDMKVCCTDPNAQITWNGSNFFTDFPYLGDASFWEYPNLYKSLSVNEPGTYNLTVRADNQYAFDSYNFQVTKSSSQHYTFSPNILPSKQSIKQPLKQTNYGK